MKEKRAESVFGVLFREGRSEVLMVKRRDIPVWVLPGGGIEEGETPEEAALREMHEETGYEVTIVRKVARYLPQNRLSRITHVFECEILNGSAQITDETADIQFFPSKKPPLTTPPFADWIVEAHANLPEVIEKKITGTSYLALLKHAILHPILVFRFLLTKLDIHLNSGSRPPH